jgi:hypothetical protein
MRPRDPDVANVIDDGVEATILQRRGGGEYKRIRVYGIDRESRLKEEASVIQWASANIQCATLSDIQ